MGVNLAYNWKLIVAHIARDLLRAETIPDEFFVAFQLSDFCYSEAGLKENELKKRHAQHEKHLVKKLSEAGEGKSVQRKIDGLTKKLEKVEEKLSELQEKLEACDDDAKAEKIQK